MRFHKTPKALERLFPQLRWRMPAGEKALYLTFDDGPGPLTEWILATLAEYKAKATFFCVGQNLGRCPELSYLIRSEGHLICNHTEHHRNGWKTPVEEYMRDVEACEARIGNKIFRPPYGHLTLLEKNALQRRGYQIVMWSFLTYDFDKELNVEVAWQQLTKCVGDGDILVFHDNLKAEANLKALLPRTLAHFAGHGYTFRALQ